MSDESKPSSESVSDAVEDTSLKKEDVPKKEDVSTQPSPAVVEPTQDSTGNDHGIETEPADNDETVKHVDEEKVDAPDQKIETETKILKDLDDEAPKTFPQILMEILNTEEESDTIAWLPHGRSFIIYKKKRFAAHVLPKYFKATKFTSFTRKLNRWGFTRVTRGPEMGSYYHKLFLRDEPNLCLRMSSHSSSKFQEQQQLMPNPMGMAFGGMPPFTMMMNPMNMNPAEINQQNQLIQAQLQQLQWQQYQLQQIQQQQAAAGMQDGSEGPGGPPGHHPNPPHHGHPLSGPHPQHPQGHPVSHAQPPHMMHGPPPHNMGPPPHAASMMGPPPGAPLGPHHHAPGAPPPLGAGVPQPPHHQVPPPHGQVIPPSQHHQGPPRSTPPPQPPIHRGGPPPPPQQQGSAPPQQQGGQPMMVHHGQGIDRPKDGTAEV